jgi:hypothetical protein
VVALDFYFYTKRRNYIAVRRDRKRRALLCANMCVPFDEDVVLVLAVLLADTNKQSVFIYNLLLLK